MSTMTTVVPANALFSSERLHFAPFTPEDYNDLKRLHQHPDIAKFSFTGYSDDARVREELTHYIALFKAYGISNLAVRERSSGAFIGRVGLEHKACDPSRGKEFELRIAILPDFWGKGYAQEGSRAILAYGLNTLKLPRIVVSHKADNHASAHIMQKLGFRYLYDVPSIYGVLPYYEIEAWA